MNDTADREALDELAAESEPDRPVPGERAHQGAGLLGGPDRDAVEDDPELEDEEGEG